MARVLWIVAAAAAAAVPVFTANTYYLYLVLTVAIMTVVGAGLNVLTGLSGQVSLGHAGFYAVGAYAGAVAATRLGVGFWTALVLAVGLAAAIGALLALAALRVSGPYLAMVTIAFGIIVEGAAVEWVGLTGGPGGIFNIPKPALGGVLLPLAGYYAVVTAAAALALGATRNLMGSAWGRAFVAVKDSDIAAESLGLGTYGIRTVAFTVSAGFAGAAGALFAFLQGYVSPDSFTLQTSILFLLIVLFGGLGTLAGPLVGGLVLVLLPELLRQLLDYRLILYGVLLLLSVYFLPRGVVGAAADLGARLRGDAGDHRRARPPAVARDPGARPRRTAHSGPPPTASAGGEAILGVEGVSVSFGGLRALENVSLRVRRGTVHSLIGPNGAGKTTLVNVISGFARPAAGAVVFGAARLEGLAPAEIARRGLVRTFQTPQLFESLSVEDNLRVALAGHRLGPLPAALAGWKRREAELRARAADLLDRAGLGEWGHAPAGRLPFGLRRRLEIARALGTGAVLLLLDEPAAGLGPAETQDLERFLTSLRAAGLTILLVEHHMELVMSVSDVVTVLDEGQVIAEGPPAAVQNDPAVVGAYLGAP